MAWTVYGADGSRSEGFNILDLFVLRRLRWRGQSMGLMALVARVLGCFLYFKTENLQGKNRDMRR